ncbi:MAG: ketoacyl-ACP synthase III [Candidatus Methylomirabilis oxygeniifera]|uniref:Beta-ketoacyl-[acyl-carrier-protein] synthase III n=1 Tax=Methylomirabilis oxygeniifera TaxID=671143 RepID=D5MFG6_METO1|nr:MAG: ketoacyl-ACP synthase III [Candidatus Methylomirabilis oxyfera]CBE68497.1 3-oxoacyl-[acyl-carrier-protein] synthase III (Beta-ketoacyl-ACP synthase III)(KAS III) [Candidatus Methylomirabilis oxyfera]
MYGSRIAGTGASVPDRVLTNAELEQMVSTSDEWIVTRTGISERRIASDDQATSDLAEGAARQALEASGVDPHDLDLILVNTVTPDMFFPSTACVLQERLGASRAAAFDLMAACAGFVYGLSVADAYLRAGVMRNILVIGADTLSKVVDWSDRGTCVLFGDGAGAVVVQRTTADPAILSTHLYSDGSKGRQLIIPGGGSRQPASQKVIDEKLVTIRMPNGNEVFKTAVRSMEEAAIAALKANGAEVSDVDLFISHQANARIIYAVAERLDLPRERIYMNIDRYGNTSAASIPIAMDEAVRAGRLKRGDLLLLTAFGGGFTWGSALIRW